MPALIRADDVARVRWLARSDNGKIVHKLGHAALVETHRVREGRVWAVRAAWDFLLGDVVRLTERPLESFKPAYSACTKIGVCKLSRARQETTCALVAVLDELTGADIVSNRDQLFARIAPIEDGVVAPLVAR